jgi:hypothetical protein
MWASCRSASTIAGRGKVESLSTANSFTVDSTLWPLVVVHLPRESVTDEEIERFVEAERVILNRRERYVAITDATKCFLFPPRQRRRMSSFLQETNEASRHLCAGLAVVMANPLLRGGMTAVFWMYQPSYSIKTFETVAGAADFLTQAAALAGLELSSAARAYLRSAPRYSA